MQSLRSPSIGVSAPSASHLGKSFYFLKESFSASDRVAEKKAKGENKETDDPFTGTLGPMPLNVERQDLKNIRFSHLATLVLRRGS